MAGFESCIRSAQAQGALSEDEADRLIRRYQEHQEHLRRSGVTDTEAGAKAALAKEAEEAAAEKKRQAALAVANRNELGNYLRTYRDKSGKPDVFNGIMNVLENFGFGAGTRSLANMARSKFDLAMGEMAQFASEFRRANFSGRRMNKPMQQDVVREMLGESTGSEAARGMAGAASRVFERLREEFNALGGNIGKLEGGYLPQFHDPAAVRKAGFKAWRDYIAPKLDLERMRDPITGGELTPERLDETLRSAWEHITTGGWSDREPQARPFGIGALANQRNEHRFLHFKTADDWLAYNRDFGRGDPIEAIFQHVRSMTRDLAAMERLGPNPNATMEWLKQVLQSEIAKHNVGKESLYTPRKMQIEEQLPWRVQAMYDHVRGAEVVSRRVATYFGNVRNIITAAQLGGTSVLAATQDPFIDMAARHLSGLPVGKAIYAAAQSFSKAGRDAAVRAGLGLDDFMHIMGEEARYAGTLGGAEWSRWLPDRVLHWTGLSPITQGRKHIFGLDFMGAIADHRELPFDQVNPYLRRTMEDYGLKAKDWDKLRAIEPFRPQPDSAGILRPADVAATNRQLAERYLEMILGQTERAVPTGTSRSRSLLTGVAQRGTVFGEILQSGLQYKSFGLSFWTLQMQALQMEMAAGSRAGAALAMGTVVARGAAYGGAIAGTLTLAGALAMQLQSVGAGKDLQAMDVKFWLAALQKGGGLGIMGDFAFADMSRFGHPFLETLAGPLLGLVADIGEPILGQLRRAAEDEKTNPGREAVKFMSRYTPLLSSMPFVRTAYRRVFLDQLQWAIDPEAHKSFHRQAVDLRSRTGQGYYWPPGQMEPTRAPRQAPPHPPRRP